MKHLIAIARLFGVPPTCFFPDDAMRQDAAPAELAAALSDDKVREMAPGPTSARRRDRRSPP